VRARVQLIGSRLTTTALSASTEYFLVRLIRSNVKTTGTGAVMTRSLPGGVKDFACVAETDLKTPTWGAIKRMYR
jgi:hypothetical protein